MVLLARLTSSPGRLMKKHPPEMKIPPKGGIFSSVGDPGCVHARALFLLEWHPSG